MEKSVNDTITANMVDTSDTQRIVIFAEEDADNVYWKDGMPIIDDRPKSFANAARNWTEANTKIAYQKPVVNSDGVTTYETAYKNAEVVILVGYGKNQITKAFNDLNSRKGLDGKKFVNDDTKLIIMGHAGATFGGVDAGGWGNIMQDTGFREKNNHFSQVAYGACSQGEGISGEACGDLSRSFGPDTEVFAQVGQPWGPGSTYNIYTTMDYESGQLRGPNFTTQHEAPKEWYEQVFTVGSGYVKFHADYGETELIEPGLGNYKLDKDGYSLEEANAFVGAHQDPKLRDQYNIDYSNYTSVSEQFEESYNLANPEAVVTWEDRPDYPEKAARHQDDWRTMQTRVFLDLKKEWWAETHDGAELPEEYLWGGEIYGGKVGANMPSADEEAFEEWYYKKEEDAIASGEMTLTQDQVYGDEQLDYMEHYHGGQTYGGGTEDITLTDYAQFLGSQRLVEQRKIPLTSEEARIQEEYDIAQSEWNTAWSAYHSGMLGEYQSGLTEPVAPPWIEGEHLLDLEDNIDYSFEEMTKDPSLAIGALVKDQNLSLGIHKLKDLYNAGNETAIAAYQEAYQKLQDSGVPEYEERSDGRNSEVFNNILEIEALRIYALSGTGEQYRSK